MAMSHFTPQGVAIPSTLPAVPFPGIISGMAELPWYPVNPHLLQQLLPTLNKETGWTGVVDLDMLIYRIQQRYPLWQTNPVAQIGRHLSKLFTIIDRSNGSPAQFKGEIQKELEESMQIDEDSRTSLGFPRGRKFFLTLAALTADYGSKKLADALAQFFFRQRRWIGKRETDSGWSQYWALGIQLILDSVTAADAHKLQHILHTLVPLGLPSPLLDPAIENAMNFQNHLPFAAIGWEPQDDAYRIVPRAPFPLRRPTRQLRRGWSSPDYRGVGYGRECVPRTMASDDHSAIMNEIQRVGNKVDTLSYVVQQRVY